jgi:hypothetical protein
MKRAILLLSLFAAWLPAVDAPCSKCVVESLTETQDESGDWIVLNAYTDSDQTAGFNVTWWYLDSSQKTITGTAYVPVTNGRGVLKILASRPQIPWFPKFGPHFWQEILQTGRLGQTGFSTGK